MANKINEIKLFECSVCKYRSLNKDEVVDHVKKDHVEETEEEQQENLCQQYSGTLRKEGYLICPHCFLAPCFFANDPIRAQKWISFLPTTSNHKANEKKRKELYYRAWRSLGNIGAFGLEEYIVKKRLALLALSERQRQRAQRKRREILPECALANIRFCCWVSLVSMTSLVALAESS